MNHLNDEAIYIAMELATLAAVLAFVVLAVVGKFGTIF
jgi:hypothetical protein